ncbi:hypothetical protein BU26DRAFT_438005 [Trematosphaeria pertusa]|uniref:Hypersensitive response inducing protein 1 n=1 Tax=Trematosphaeria pertusa TaxID=390896 RepID=A0A6A6HXH6_9PLEO|nr:uncharacterized protein BU26DRAFT_438005 [Trematosphaeria pertusa]KAF2242915.1 hypothetical protein BU26DRAFT_438005 [Trematosphaeria pertusa]
MRYLKLASLLLPAASLAAPTSLSARQDPACAPTSYAIADFTYTTGPSSSSPHVSFNFQSFFSNPAIINDPSSAGATCDADGESVDAFPMETECSTGRVNLMFDLRAPVDQANFQIIHTWHCNGQTWMSSTPHKIDPVNCDGSDDGATTCTSASGTFAPQNVRQICSTPTCP